MTVVPTDVTTGVAAATSACEVPELMRRYVARSVPDHCAVPRRVRITQDGEMWQKQGGRALRFTATEVFAVERVAFAWRARFPVLGPVAIRVADELADGEGRLEARLLGIPVQRQTGPDTAAGEALRYLAELPWVPFAIAHNRELRWRELEARKVEVATSVGGERVALELGLDAAGDIVRVFAPMRPRLVGKRAVPTPWVGEFGNYELLAGIRVPRRAEVRWELAEGPFVYWRGTVTSLAVEPGDGTTSDGAKGGHA